ncbi:hypothetical protein K458DRAFT_36521 [Lentithecium fluviatile CBS 122367]|uniref:Secreted protein n=1 Tax=Lentithecium fluviatile CBS 122367 TaxID=1168545 RepID=A0A6G1J1K6_9PLEO|nr:hypothetical protein K458DRAFT_36521 [Lentithecium fluviatile CBS 122367]
MCLGTTVLSLHCALSSLLWFSCVISAGDQTAPPSPRVVTCFWKILRTNSWRLHRTCLSFPVPCAPNSRQIFTTRD